MHDKLKKLASKARIDRFTRLPDILRIFLKDEAIGGKLILAAALLALLIANSPLVGYYESFWKQHLSVGVNQFIIDLDLRHWVSEGLMALFFLVVGLEIKREVIRGNLLKFKSAVLPIGAAIGGMVVPATIFVLINLNHPANLDGWAIPIATDIAFALAVISLLGRRVSSTLKVFLLTISIVDDIGAILIIGLFYGAGYELPALAIAAVIAAVLYAFRAHKYMSAPVFILIGLGFWLAIFNSGVHASLAGAFLGFLAPLNAPINRYSIAERLERLVLPISTFIVLPLFAFANFGVKLSFEGVQAPGASSLMWGIILGLFLGKAIGISLITWILVKLRMTRLPAHANWMQVIGVGFIAGIGFTVSVFIADLAYTGQPMLVNAAKLAILAGSTMSAIFGYFFLRYRRRIREVLDTEI
ncbi:Na+/H+ antiporter NhaA [Candidatus Parcubacteria bacterium]|nr:Na+/H+ antiporter NhaA [Candidatus Parcubacteria bacterium]